MNGAADGGNQRVGIRMRAHKEPAIPSFLLYRLVHRHRRRRNDVLVVEIWHHGDDAARLGADADEFHHAIGPPQLAVQRVLSGIEQVGQALADDHHALRAFLVAIVEVAARNRARQRCQRIPARRSGTWRG